VRLAFLFFDLSVVTLLLRLRYITGQKIVCGLTQTGRAVSC